DFPGGLIAAELTQLVKEFTRKDHRMAPTTTIRGQGNTATVGPPVLRHLVDHRAIDSRLIAKEHHDSLSAWVDSSHTGFVGTRAAFGEDRVNDDLGTCVAQPGPDLISGTAQDHNHLIECTGRLSLCHDPIEQDCAPKRQELFRLAHAA